MTSLRELIKTVPLPELDTEYRFNHDKCGDTRKRLYIRRTYDGRVLAYCFNCCERYHGAATHAAGSLMSSKGKGTSQESGFARARVSLPDKSSYFPRKAIEFLAKGGITVPRAERYGIFYSEKLKRVILPVYNSDGELLSYQGRSLDTSKNPPKYLTWGKRSPLLLHTNDAKVTVVEDYLSAIRCSTFTSSAALLGTSADVKLLNWLGKYKQVNIFLDNDNVIVAKAQLRLYNTLSLLVSTVKLIHNSCDPKELTDTELEELL